MPRNARIDAAGALHHIICLGIERRKMFWTDFDRDDFLGRLETVLFKSLRVNSSQLAVE
jgi:putative transposase